MYKKFTLFLCGTVFLLNVNVMAMEDLKDDSSPSGGHFRILPTETIVNIADYLYGDDFHNFSVTCTSIRNTLIGYKKFFIPEEEAKVKEIIMRTHLENIPSLILKWSRTSKQEAISRLRSVLQEFKYTQPSKTEENLKPFYKQYKERLKILNILYALGDKKSDQSFRKIYYENQVGIELARELSMTNSVVITDPKFYVFYKKNLALIDPSIRREIGTSYKEGLFPFTKDDIKSHKYSKKLELPWFPGIK